MEKTATLNLRVNPVSKKRADEILKQLGIPMSVAVDMYLNQIYLVGGIPFPVTVPDRHITANADELSDESLKEKLTAGVMAARKGKHEDAAEAFARHREQR